MHAGTESDHTDREARLDDLLASCLERFRRGEAIDREAIADAYPEYATDLMAFLDDQERLHRMAGWFRDAGVSTPDLDDARPTPPPPQTIEAGRIVGDYEILGILGWGGMGIVYEARQRSLGRRVALKMLRSGPAATPKDLIRFRREAQTIARLSHPHIVPVHEVGDHEGHLYFSMERVDGGSLASRLTDYLDDLRATAELMAKVARAIQHAHDQGVLHRDLKPSNVLVDGRGEPRVVDFGLAMLVSRGDDALTSTGEAPGTPSYMAPEQVVGRHAITTATDIHGMGTILYVLLTGRPPFRGGTALEKLEQVRDVLPESPRSVRRSIPRDLETICLKCLQKAPKDRYATAAEMADDLDRWRQGRPIRARRTGPIGRSWRLIRRYPWTSMVAVVVIVFAVAGLLDLRERARRDEDARRQAQVLADGQFAHGLGLVWRDIEGNKLESARPRIEALRPPPGGSEEAGFVFRFLERVTHVGRPPLVHVKDALYSSAFSPDGGILAVVGADRMLRLVDPKTGQSRSVEAHASEVNSVAYSPDGRRIATASEDGTVRIWDARTLQVVKTLPSHEDEVVATVFTPDSRRLISGARLGKVIVWDASTWRPLRSFQLPIAPKLQGLAISPDGATLAASGNGVVVLEMAGGPEAARPRVILDKWNVNGLAFSPDGRILAGAGPGSLVTIWQTGTWKEIASWPLMDQFAEGVAFSPDGQRIAAVARWGMVHLIDPVRGVQDRIASGQKRIWGATFSPDGRTLATASNDGMLKLWDLQRDGMRIGVALPTDNHEPGAEFSPDGEEITITDNAGRVWIHSARRGELRKALKLDSGEPITEVRLSPDSRWAAARSPSGRVQVFRLPDGRPGPALDRVDGVVRAISSGGRWLIADHGQDRGGLELWDLARGSMTFYPEENTFDNVVFSPEADQFSVFFWFEERQCLGRVDAVGFRPTRRRLHVGLHSQAFSQDGKRLATADQQGQIVIWDVATWEPTVEIHELTTAIHTVAFAPDGRTLASGGEDHLVILWDISTGRRLATLRGHSGPVQQVRFAPDGRTLASVADSPQPGSELFLWPATRAD